MKYLVPLSLSLMVALSLGGCGKSEEGTEEAAPDTGVVEESKSDVVSTLKEAGEKGMEAATEMAENVTEKGAEMAASAKEQGAELAAAAVAKAEELIEKVKQYLADKDMDLASAAMEQLRGMKESLPESLQEAIDKLEAMFSSEQGAAVPPPAGQ